MADTQVDMNEMNREIDRDLRDIDGENRGSDATLRDSGKERRQPKPSPHRSSATASPR